MKSLHGRGTHRQGRDDSPWRQSWLRGRIVVRTLCALRALRLYGNGLYGNEPVHFKDDPDRQLHSRDVPGLLASVLRVIQHLQDGPPRS